MPEQNYEPDPTGSVDPLKPYSHGVIKQVSAGNPAKLLVEANPLRTSISLFNTQAAAGLTVYYGYTSGVNSTNGHPLPPQTRHTVTEQGRIWVYSASAAVVAYAEDSY